VAWWTRLGKGARSVARGPCDSPTDLLHQRRSPSRPGKLGRRGGLRSALAGSSHRLAESCGGGTARSIRRSSVTDRVAKIPRPTTMDCGGMRSATPLWVEVAQGGEPSALYWQEKRRRASLATAVQSDFVTGPVRWSKRPADLLDTRLWTGYVKGP